jgi:hypothetical protein
MEKEKLLLTEIEAPNMGTIYPPITRDIIKMSENKLDEMLLVFILKIEDLKLESNAIVNIEKDIGRKLTILDYLSGDIDTRNSIINSLKFIYKTEDVYFYTYDNDFSYLVNYTLLDGYYNPNDNSVRINNDNWDELSDIVKRLMGISNANKEERKVTVEHEENRALLEEYLRLQKQAEEEKKKLEEKNKLSTHDIITIVAKDCHWDYDKVLDMTYYRLINAYRSIMSDDNYRVSLMYHMSEKWDTGNMKIEHWIDAIRKNN